MKGYLPCQRCRISSIKSMCVCEYVFTVDGEGQVIPKAVFIGIAAYQLLEQLFEGLFHRTSGIL